MTQNTINALITSCAVIGSLAIVGTTIREVQRKWISYIRDRDDKDRESGSTIQRY